MNLLRLNYENEIQLSRIFRDVMNLWFIVKFMWGVAFLKVLSFFWNQSAVSPSPPETSLPNNFLLFFCHIRFLQRHFFPFWISENLWLSSEHFNRPFLSRKWVINFPPTPVNFFPLFSHFRIGFLKIQNRIKLWFNRVRILKACVKCFCLNYSRRYPSMTVLKFIFHKKNLFFFLVSFYILNNLIKFNFWL